MPFATRWELAMPTTHLRATLAAITTILAAIVTPATAQPVEEFYRGKKHGTGHYVFASSGMSEVDKLITKAIKARKDDIKLLRDAAVSKLGAVAAPNSVGTATGPAAEASGAEPNAEPALK